MLSTEYSMLEVKKNLMAYTEYGYSTDALFEAKLTEVADKVKYDLLYDLISDYYDDEIIEDISVGAYDYDDFMKTMSTVDRHLYLGEAYLVCAEFLKGLAFEDTQMGEAEATYSMEGYSQSGTNNPKKKAAGLMTNKAREHLLRAGIDLTYSISRTVPRGTDLAFQDHVIIKVDE